MALPVSYMYWSPSWFLFPIFEFGLSQSGYVTLIVLLYILYEGDVGGGVHDLLFVANK